MGGKHEALLAVSLPVLSSRTSWGAPSTATDARSRALCTFHFLFAAPTYLAYTLCSQAPLLKSVSAATTWTFNEIGALWSSSSSNKRRRRLLDSETHVEASIGHFKAGFQNASCSLALSISADYNSCLASSVSLSKSSKPLLLGLKPGSQPGRYNIQTVLKCQRFLGVAPGCTDAGLQWYSSPQENLTEWEFSPSPGPAMGPIIAAATSNLPCGCRKDSFGGGLSLDCSDVFCLTASGYLPELKITDPPTGPKPNHYYIELTAKASIYNGSFAAQAVQQYYRLSKQDGGWERPGVGVQDMLPACTSYKATISKGYSVNGLLVGGRECDVESSYLGTCWEAEDVGRAFKYKTPPSLPRTGVTGGCGARTSKLQLADKRDCSSSREYASYKNVACGSVALSVGAAGSLSNWVLNMTGNGLVTIHAKAPVGTTLKCKGAYLAPKPGCDEGGLVLQRSPYTWRLHSFRVGIESYDKHAVVAESKGKTCRRVLGVSRSCASKTLALYTESRAKTAAFGWQFPSTNSAIPAIKSTTSICNSTKRNCEGTVTVSSGSSSSIKPVLYHFEVSKTQDFHRYSVEFYTSNTTIKFDALQCASYEYKVRYLAGKGWNAVWSPFSPVKTAKMGNCGGPVKWVISPVPSANCSKRKTQYLNRGTGPPRLGALTNSSVWTFAVADVKVGGRLGYEFGPFVWAKEDYPYPCTYKLALSPLQSASLNALDMEKACGLSASGATTPAEWYVHSVGSKAHIRFQVGTCKRYLGLSADCSNDQLVLYETSSFNGVDDSNLMLWQMETVPRPRPVVTSANITCGEQFDLNNPLNNATICVCTSSIRLRPASGPTAVSYTVESNPTGTYAGLVTLYSNFLSYYIKDPSYSTDSAGNVLLKSKFIDTRKYWPGDSSTERAFCDQEQQCSRATITAVAHRRTPASSLEIDAVTDPFPATVCKT